MKRTLLIFLFSSIAISSRADLKKVSVTGNWTSNETWVSGAPGNGDSVVVPTGLILTVNANNLGPFSGMRITVEAGAEIIIGGGKKLELEDDGIIYLLGNGKLSAENHGSLGFIGGTEVIQGSTGPATTVTLTGPLKITKDGQFPLPIQLVFFSAKEEGGKVLLTWATGVEVNNDYFSIERSLDGISFEVIGRIKGAGTSSRQLNYSFLDEKPFEDISYYRLKQTDYDGKFEYFALGSANIRSKTQFSVYPSPAASAEMVNVSYFSAHQEEGAIINIYNAEGSIVLSKTQSISEGRNLLSFENNLSTGLYLLRMTVGRHSYTEKVIIQ
ncbi:MAG: T9SS type A sorting domain-containing protein [Bacteroidetes bacterium]|nr:T9SS type A sorting domain-containing protein [Bacteroidota bacterium]